MASKTKAPSRLEGIPPATVRGAIELLASELAANRYLALAATHVALGFYALPKKTIEGPKTSKKLGGLHYASRGLSDFLRYAAKVLDWPELDGLASLAKYDTLRRIVLREYRPHPDSDKEKKSYFLFLAIILLYVMELTVSSEEFSRSIPLKEFELFDAEDYFDRLFSTNPDARPPVYLFPKPTIAVSSLIEVLRVELGIENPVDSAIGDHFRVPPTSPAKYICYRFTTRQNFISSIKNKITKSYLELSRPASNSDIYSFKHRYRDIDGFDRVTSGFVVKLAKTFYFVGGSRRPEDRPTVGLKIISVPSDDVFTRYDHQFIFGLFMSNDSALNSIAGRILLARARADSTESTAENYKRIDESEFLEDLKTHAAGSDYLKTEDEMWLKETIRNYDPEWGSEINTALMTAQRRPFA